MRKDIIKMSIEEYNAIIEKKDSATHHAWEKADEYMKWYRNETNETYKLAKENGYLKALFDKEGDTQVIKYNGKLYRIVSMQLCKGDGEETLDISLVPVSEVG